MTVFRILYRGSLSSCNYACHYCPFAKQRNTRQELQTDREQLMRFVGWVSAQHHQIGVFFTPWGEALIHRYYRRAMIDLSHLPHVVRVVMQTNLSGKLAELADADASKLALWTTFHPGEVPMERFVDRLQQLSAMGIRFSVGMVGLREHMPWIEELRSRLPGEVYLWINAYKGLANYYTRDEVKRLRAVDPYFDWNRRAYASFGKLCDAGRTSFTVDGRGDARRCHFVDHPMGNIYDDDVFAILQPRPCPNRCCGCHIGYVHRPQLELGELFGDNVLERIPQHWPGLDRRFAFHDASNEGKRSC